MSAFAPQPNDPTGAPSQQAEQARQAQEAVAVAAADAAEAAEETAPGTALERLAASRERMREFMVHGGRRGQARQRAEAARAAGEKPAWFDRLHDVPVLGVVMEATSAWWAAHPMQPAAHLAGGVVRNRLVPLARQHPLAVVFAGFLVGVVLMRWRPWRSLAKSAVFAGLAAQIVSRLIAAVPLESLFDIFNPSARRTAPDESSGAAAPPTDAAAMPPPPAATPAYSAPVSAATAQAETVTP